MVIAVLLIVLLLLTILLGFDLLKLGDLALVILNGLCTFVCTLTEVLIWCIFLFIFARSNGFLMIFVLFSNLPMKYYYQCLNKAISLMSFSLCTCLLAVKIGFPVVIMLSNTAYSAVSSYHTFFECLGFFHVSCDALGRCFRFTCKTHKPAFVTLLKFNCVIQLFAASFLNCSAYYLNIIPTRLHSCLSTPHELFSCIFAIPVEVNYKDMQLNVLNTIDVIHVNYCYMHASRTLRVNNRLNQILVIVSLWLTWLI